ncbi:hypothetical protein Cgig2_005517 [Carnegiea gigantea]|uniref:Peptidase S54 rhomboid domain-containing protein n=1 Tax=Carnegiea gigantea TaxID=171969 RepID=A0A9Q1Q6J4_9CARY|nr:hypothetical protein Cgig2_005517 [Carnegiea gigantea]
MMPSQLPVPHAYVSLVGTHQERRQELKEARHRKYPAEAHLLVDVGRISSWLLTVYVAQIASQGKLMLWGAKINSLIDKGQFWRLVTSSLLHANVGHLMVRFQTDHLFLQMIGLLSKGIDNWGHLGGLLGGAAISWLVGPAWKYQYTDRDGRRVFADRAPISYLIRRGPQQFK